MNSIDQISAPTAGAPPARRPNHHGELGPATGVVGCLSGLTMVLGRKRDAELVARLVRLDGTDVVIDIGCGPGVAARSAARQGARATGIDPSPSMLGLARFFSRLGRRRVDVEWLRSRAEDLRLPNETGTVCWSLASVHHWRDLDAALLEVSRVLRPGGRFVALERRTQPGASGWADHGWTPNQAAQFAALLDAAGFIDVRVTDHDLGRRELVAVAATKPIRTVPGRDQPARRES